MSALAFTQALGALGGPAVGLALCVFAFTTTLGWSYYGERCAQYLFGPRVIKPYRFLWIFAVALGAVVKLQVVWTLADIFNGLMALPNLIALALLSPVVFKLSQAAFTDATQSTDQA